jgi:hypothetical protein
VPSFYFLLSTDCAVRLGLFTLTFITPQSYKNQFVTRIVSRVKMVISRGPHRGYEQRAHFVEEPGTRNSVISLRHNGLRMSLFSGLRRGDAKAFR